MLTTAWAFATPPWQAPDEPDHFSYVQTIAELGRLPGGAGLADSTELSRATAATNADQVVFNNRAKPEWTPLARKRFAAATRPEQRKDGGGPNSTSTYPPLYYALEAIPYKAAGSGDVFTRLTIVRVTSGLWLLLTVTAAWLLCGELFGRRRIVQLTGAATVGLWPMMTFISSGVNCDALVIALWTLTAWLGVKVLRHGLTMRRALALGLTVGAALVTKASSLVLPPIVLALLALILWRERARWHRALPTAAIAVVVMATPFAVYTIGTRAADRPAYAQASEISSGSSRAFEPREFASYLWQFYLPQLPFMQPRIENQYAVISHRPAINIWLGSGSGVFGWVNTWFPRWVYWIVGGAVSLLALLFAAASARWWRQTPRGQRLRRLTPAVFLAGIAVVTLAALHYADYGYYVNQSGFFIQGRYLLPLAAVLAAAAGWALLALPRRARPAAAGIWIGLLFCFQLASLALVLNRWYA